MKHIIKIKRIYEVPEKADGYRMLVDRLWPRGLKKELAFIDEWNKTIAPSPAIRKWFAHKPENFDRFAQLYKKELAEQKAELERIRSITKTQHVTLLYAARDTKINHASILLQVLSTQKNKA